MSKATLLFMFVCFAFGSLILVHQYVFYGVWFEAADIHHETFSVGLFCLGLGAALGGVKKGNSRL